jgi:hypothetical protein
MTERNFIIDQNTNLTETRLETYSNESDFERVGQEVFQEHSNYFTPTLDKIKSVKEPSNDPLAGPIYSFYSEKFGDLPQEKVEQLANNYINLTNMLEKKLTKGNLEKVLFDQVEENLDNSSEGCSTEVKTKSVRENRILFWDFHNKFKTTLYKIKNMSEPSSADPTAGVFDPSYQTQHKLGTEKEFFQQMDHHEYLRFPLNNIKDVYKFKLNSTSESWAEKSRLQHDQADRFFEADLNDVCTTQGNFQDRLGFLQEFLHSNFERIPIPKTFINNLHCYPGSSSDLIKAANFYSDVENKAFFATTFETTKVYGNYILKHPNIKESIDLVANQLINDIHCNSFHIELLRGVSEHFEFFSFVTFEPCLFKCLGPYLFFKIFRPLHHSGAFTAFIKSVINKVNENE